ncbi:hypothetical protein CUMW_089430 [Citrus unshiu]|nr:hypothetical protein CUMW_089430 [Citrus unshiu]
MEEESVEYERNQPMHDVLDFSDRRSRRDPITPGLVSTGDILDPIRSIDAINSDKELMLNESLLKYLEERRRGKQRGFSIRNTNEYWKNRRSESPKMSKKKQEQFYSIVREEAADRKAKRAMARMEIMKGGQHLQKNEDDYFGLDEILREQALSQENKTVGQQQQPSEFHKSIDIETAHEEELKRQKEALRLQEELETSFNLQKEVEKLETMAADTKLQFLDIEKIVSVLSQIEQESSSGTLTLDSLAYYFIDLKRRFSLDFEVLKLSRVAYSLALPFFMRMFQGWQPLRNPSHKLDVVSVWMDVLEFDYCCDDSEKSMPYTWLVSKIVLPALSMSSANTWDTSDSEQMLRFLECWENLLPPSVFYTILNEIVMPKLSSAIESWDALRETVPIHDLVLPWIPFLGFRVGGGLYEMILTKLRSVLDACHPGDVSAYSILSPWKIMIDTETWEQLMSQYVDPKLRKAAGQAQEKAAAADLDSGTLIDGMDAGSDGGMTRRPLQVILVELEKSPENQNLVNGDEMLSLATDAAQVLQPGFRKRCYRMVLRTIPLEDA